MDFKQLDPNIEEDAKFIKALIWWEDNPDYVPRKLLESRVDTNYLNYSWRCDHPTLKDIVDTLYLAMPFEGNYKIAAKKQHIEGIITFLFISRMFVDKWIAFWRKKSAYSKPKGSQKSRYENATNYSYHFTKIITDYLIENNYVEFEVGQWGKNKEGNLSRMRPTKKFFNLFRTVKIKDLYTVAETVLLREDDSTSGKKHYIEYDENVFTTNARNNLSLINEVIRAHHYTLHLPDTVRD